MKIGQYNPSEIESRWQEVWEKGKIYSPDLDRPFGKAQGKPFYNLMMFPYPSAEGMHVGNMYAFTGADVYGRFQRMQGKDVFEPIGLDGFGIHSENYAIKIGNHPVEQAKISEKNFYRQLKSIGNSFDWTRTVETYKPEYYKWTQWVFIQLFKAGLAYRKKAPVNFCPSCKTVLADEQVVAKSKIEETINVCERCETEIEKRDLEQWFFKITKYADRLLNGLTQIDWSEKVKIAQKQWIGKSEGLIFTACVKNSALKIQTFSAHFEAFKADTFVVIAPDHPLLEKLIEDVPNKQEILDFSNKIVQKRKNEGKVEEKTPEGIFIGKYIVDPVGNGDLPIWVANFAIKEYGTGIVKCSAHDERDFAFAKKYGIRLKAVLVPKDPELKKRVEYLEVCYSDMKDGYLTEPAEFAGKRAGDLRQEVVKYVVKHGLAKPENQYHLRDWLISRQRYWGPPIPLVFCEDCALRIKDKGLMIKDEFNKGEMENPGWIAVAEKDLPVELPYIEDYKPLGTGQAPLASHPEFYETTCPKCGGEAKRETDVSDTFLDSAWYFLRYVSTDIDTTAFDRERVKKWLPVNMYIGGAEHSVLHLLYSRFITMALKDIGLIGFEEPFTKFRAHGLIIKDGAKMSKSKGNVVVPDAYIKKFGADSLRAYLMFSGPFSQGGDFRDSGIEGMFKFLRRVWTLFQCHPELVSGSPASRQGSLQTNEMLNSPKRTFLSGGGAVQYDTENLQMMHKTIKKVTEDILNLSYNTSIAGLMEYYNFLSDQKSISREEVEVFLKLLAPFAPHISEELYQLLTNKREFVSIHVSEWPKYDPKFLVKNEVVIAVQINGKLRGDIRVSSEKLAIKSYIEDLAKKDANVARHLEGKEIKKAIYVEGRIINFVVV